MSGSDTLYHRLFSHPPMVEQLVREFVPEASGLEQRHPPEELAGLIDEVLGWFRRHADYDELRRLFSELVRQAVADVGASAPLPDDLMEIKTMLATQGQAWKRQWLAEGKAEGRAEGKAEGKAEGRAEALIRLAEKRFGPVPAALRDRILAADPATVEHWFDRAIDAPSLDDVFDSTN